MTDDDFEIEFPEGFTDDHKQGFREWLKSKGYRLTKAGSDNFLPAALSRAISSMSEDEQLELAHQLISRRRAATAARAKAPPDPAKDDPAKAKPKPGFRWI